MPSKRMYVIARAQLDPIYQCVQGGHALAAYAMDRPELTEEWDNQYLIYLNTYALDDLMHKLTINCIPFSHFEEPDMGNCITAIACYCDGSLFKDLKLVRA